MRERKLFGVIVAFVLAASLAVSLVAGACAPAAPTGEEGAAEIAALEADLSASEKEVKDLEGDVSDLEDEIAALKKPAKVYRFEPACEMGVGALWNNMHYWSDIVNEASDGRIVSTPSLPGAVIPVEEQIEAVAAGTTGVMMSCPSYYPGKVPVAGLMNMGLAMLSPMEKQYAFEYFMDGRIAEIMSKAYEDRYNVEVFGNSYDPVLAIMSLIAPIVRITDLDGRLFRCGDEHFAYCLDKLGVATVWAPSPEIYTMLATAAVDGFTFGGASDHYALSAHEVAPYWMTNSIGAARVNQWVINRDTWNEMPEDLQSLCMAAVDASSGRGIVESFQADDQSWEKAIEGGVIPFTLPDEDINLWIAYEMEYVETLSVDPEVAQVYDIVIAWAEYKGRM